jgi:hypothetical protein
LTISENDSIYYTDSAHITDLPGGGDTTVSLETWSANPDDNNRTLSVSAITALSGDSNRTNDTLYKEIVLGPEFLCGDADGDRIVNIFDVTYLIDYLYFDGPPPVNLQTCNVNSDDVVNIFDITYLIVYLYLNGSPPNCP